MISDKHAPDDKFEFANTLQFDQQKFVELNGGTRGEEYPFVIAGFALAGILMLFWSYTLLLGIMVLVALGFVVFAPHKFPNSNAWYYRVRPLYQQEILYGVNDQGLRFETQGAEAEIIWARTSVWEERGDLLRISPVNFPNCWFHISELKQAGVHEMVMDKCRRYGKKFKSK